MDLRGEPTVATLLNQHNFQPYFKHLLSYTQISLVLTSHQGNFSVTKTITENHNGSEYREQVSMGCTVSVDTPTAQLLHLRTSQRGGQKTARYRGLGKSAVRVSHRNDRAAPSMLPQHYGFLN